MIKRGTPPERREIAELRKFGILVGGLLVLIGFAPVRHRLPPRSALLALGGLLVILAATRPTILRRPHRLWMKFAEILGWINTRVLLTFVFLFVLTPIALVRRLSGGGDSRRFRSGEATYVEPAESRDPKHVELQY